MTTFASCVTVRCTKWSSCLFFLRNKLKLNSNFDLLSSIACIFKSGAFECLFTLVSYDRSGNSLSWSQSHFLTFAFSDGCEILLGKDFDICIQCFDVGAYKVVYDQNPRRKRERQSTKVHTGNMVQDRRSQCPCKKVSSVLHCMSKCFMPLIHLLYIYLGLYVQRL